MIFARFFYLVQVLVFKIIFCLILILKFFCLSVTFLWYRSYVSIRLLRKSDSHFFWHRIREEFIRSRDSSVQKQRKFALFLLRNGNSRELLIRGAQLLGTILLWDLSWSFSRYQMRPHVPTDVETWPRVVLTTIQVLRCLNWLSPMAEPSWVCSRAIFISSGHVRDLYSHIYFAIVLMKKRSQGCFATALVNRAVPRSLSDYYMTRDSISLEYHIGNTSNSWKSDGPQSENLWNLILQLESHKNICLK